MSTLHLLQKMALIQLIAVLIVLKNASAKGNVDHGCRMTDANFTECLEAMIRVKFPFVNSAYELQVHEKPTLFFLPGIMQELEMDQSFYVIYTSNTYLKNVEGFKIRAHHIDRNIQVFSVVLQFPNIFTTSDCEVAGNQNVGVLAQGNFTVTSYNVDLIVQFRLGSATNYVYSRETGARIKDVAVELTVKDYFVNFVLDDKSYSQELNQELNSEKQYYMQYIIPNIEKVLAKKLREVHRRYFAY